MRAGNLVDHVKAQAILLALHLIVVAVNSYESSTKLFVTDVSKILTVVGW